MTVLTIDGIGKSFGGLRALDDINFHVDRGEIVGLMGANGAGKTTLFSVIAGHTRPDHGNVIFHGKNTIGLRPDKICRLGIARTFQIVRPFSGMTVRENVETAIIFGAPGQTNERSCEKQALDILEEVGLVNVADKLAGALTLSGRKRLEVARALGTGPEVLLLDEVMAGLTPAEVEQMIVTIEQVKQSRNLALIVVEHVVQALVTLSHRIVVLHHGQKIAEGLPEEIAKHPDVLKAYFGEVSA